MLKHAVSAAARIGYAAYMAGSVVQTVGPELERIHARRALRGAPVSGVRVAPEHLGSPDRIV
jgi:hypothetical protein